MTVPRERESPVLETVAILYNQAEVALLTARLESAGIPVLPHSRHHSSVGWHLVVALGGVKLQVPSGLSDDARALLSELPPWEATRGIFSSNRALDIFIAPLLLFVAGGPPPPARFEGIRPQRLEQAAE